MNLGQRLGIAQRVARASELAAREGVRLRDRHYQIVDQSWSEARAIHEPYTNGSSKSRSTSVRMERTAKLPRQPARKVPLETATTIRALYDAGNISYRDLAAQFGCGFRCIGQIINREGAYRSDP